MRNLCLVFGDQLSPRIASLDHFDHQQDVIWMAEVDQEATHVWCHKKRLVLFFSAMRHFRDSLRQRDFEVSYQALTHRRSDDRGADFATILRKDIKLLRPEKIVVTQPGDYRVLNAIRDQAEASGVPLEIREDMHFLCRLQDFHDWARDRKNLVMEDFYRYQRKSQKILLDDDQQPLGGQWNFDKQNRQTFGKEGPPPVAAPRAFAPDETTREVIAMVEKRFHDHPGRADDFDYPVTSEDAEAALQDFITHRLSGFGDFQDALWTEQPFLYHSRISAVMNMHLIDPRDALDAAVSAYHAGNAPLNSVEGFVRQILGWREFIRGVYWTYMPEYIDRNALDCDEVDVPAYFWHGQTDMRCIADSMHNVIDHAYAHHIQRLMILGLFSQLLGVHPRKFHEWHMAMYADAVDWVSLPNALGMSQFGDGGVVGTKPYCASGNYVHKMSNYCKACRYDPKQAVGEQACPFTTLYWDFLDRHHDRFQKNHRMVFQIKNLERKPEQDLTAIRKAAAKLKTQ